MFLLKLQPRTVELISKNQPVVEIFMSHRCIWRRNPLLTGIVRLKHDLDTSLLPKLQESELEERFVRGSGPGGQAVNKASNCVVLTHKPTGIVVKVHQSRLLHENRKIARELLTQKLDGLINGENSLASQQQRIDNEKRIRREQRRRQQSVLKSQWLAREGLLPKDPSG